MLLLEAGADYPDIQTMPDELKRAWGITRDMKRTTHDWHFTARMTPKNETLVARGKVTGGSSAVNSTAVFRGEPADYDEWAASDLPEWTFEKCLPFFKRLENDLDFQDQWHGTEGPIMVRRWPRELWLPQQIAFYNACRALGFEDNPDFSRPGSTGIGPMPQNNADGIRLSTAIAYLNPVRHRPNLAIRSQCMALRVVLNGNRAVGVEVEDKGKRSIVEGDEIILSAGAIGSPHLLLVSGIGSAAHLASLGIPVVHDLPGVGQNLKDDPQVQVRWKARPGVPLDPTRPSLQLYLRYTDQTAGEQNNMLMSCVAATASPTNYLTAVSGTSELNPVGIGFVVFMYRRQTHGELKLQSKDIHVQPNMDYNHMSQPVELARMREGIRLVQELCQQSDLKEMLTERISPTEEDLATDEALDDWILRNVGSSSHVSCTCKMGPSSDPTAVVDQRGRVHGVEGLLVADASIMPNQPRCAINAPTLMIGERIADMIKQRH